MCNTAIARNGEIMCAYQYVHMEHTGAGCPRVPLKKIGKFTGVYRPLCDPYVLKKRWRTDSNENHVRKYRCTRKAHLSSLCLFFETYLHFPSKPCYS